MTPSALHDQFLTTVKGAVGIGAPVFGVVMSNLDKIEQMMRLASLFGGLVVCGLTIRSLLRKKGDDEDEDGEGESE